MFYKSFSLNDEELNEQRQRIIKEVFKIKEQETEIDAFNDGNHVYKKVKEKNRRFLLNSFLK